MVLLLIAFHCPRGFDNIKVRDISDSNGDWNLESISHIVDARVLNGVASINVPRYANIPDHPSRVGSPNGNFTSASAYKTIYS